MAGKSKEKDFPEQEIYSNIETEIRKLPFVLNFTSQGYTDFVNTIGEAFGKSSHKGILVHHGKKGITIAISVSVLFSADSKSTLPEIGRKIQSVVLDVVTSLTSDPVEHIDVVIAEIHKESKK